MSSDYVMLIFLSKHFRNYLDDLKRDIDFGPDVRLKADDFAAGEPYGVFSNVKACFYYLTNWYKYSPIGRIIKNIEGIVQPVEYSPEYTEEERKADYRYSHFMNQNVFHIETHINFKNQYKRSYFIKVKDLLQIDIDSRIGEYEHNPPAEADINMDKMFFIVEHTGSSFEAFETATEVLYSVNEWESVKNNVYVSYLNRGCGEGREPGRPNYIDGTCSTITLARLEDIASHERGEMNETGLDISNAFGRSSNQPVDINDIMRSYLPPSSYARFSAALRPKKRNSTNSKPKK